MSSDRLSLALQGGGAHGAFTWGVLDRLLEEPDFVPSAISGSSAGAMNAAVLVDGWERNGREGARAALNRFWQAVSRQSPLSWLDLPGAPGLEDRFSFSWHQVLLKVLSQVAVGDVNPLDSNPLRDILADQLDFDRIRRSQIRLFIAATHVRTGQLRLFGNADLSLESLLASAALPQLQGSQEYQGEAYWDGGFCANPALHPLVYDVTGRDILLVLLQPLECRRLPEGVDAVAERVRELGFSSHLLRELRSLALARRYAGRRRWWRGALERRLLSLRFHLMEPDAELAALPGVSRYDTRLAFLERLCTSGRQTAETWLDDGGMPGDRRAGLDLEARFI